LRLNPKEERVLKIGIFRKWLAFLLLGFFILNSLAFAENKSANPAKSPATLETLDAHLAKYKNFDAFISDKSGLIQYRELLKDYMHYDDSFDEIFHETVRQMQVLNQEVADFGKKIWRNQAQNEKPIVIEGSKSQRSGIETDRETLESKLTEAREKYFATGKSILDIQDKLTQAQALKNLLASVLKQFAAFEKKYPEDIRKEHPTGSEMKRINADPKKRQERQKFFEEVRHFRETNIDFKTYLATLRYKITASESWLDVYRRTFGEDSIGALKTLDSFESAEVNVPQILGEFMPPENILHAAKTTDPFYASAQENWARLFSARKELVAIPTREPAELAQDIHEMNTFARKIQLASNAHRKNLYRLPILINHDQRTVELRSQTSESMHLTPMHAVHAAFAGKFTNECVGGGKLENLTPRRWALSALEGVRTYAASKGENFDGVVRIIPVHPSNSPAEIYESVDMMMKSISDSIEIKSRVTGQTAKYPLFDAILDQLTRGANSKGFVEGDGTSISQNTGLAKVFAQSPSVITATQLPEELLLTLSDATLSSSINKSFTLSPYGYNPGEMIFEGMPGDGTRRFILTPKDQRKKFSQEELEEMLIESKIEERNIFTSQVWSLAVESNVRLRAPSYYQQPHSAMFEQWLEKAIKDQNKMKTAFHFLASANANQLSVATVQKLATEKNLTALIPHAQPEDVSEFLLSEPAKVLEPQIIISALRTLAALTGNDFYKWLGAKGMKLPKDVLTAFATKEQLVKSASAEEHIHALDFLGSDTAKLIDSRVLRDVIQALVEEPEPFQTYYWLRQNKAAKNLDPSIVTSIFHGDLLENQLLDRTKSTDLLNFISSPLGAHLDKDVIVEKLQILARTNDGILNGPLERWLTSDEKIPAEIVRKFATTDILAHGYFSRGRERLMKFLGSPNGEKVDFAQIEPLIESQKLLSPDSDDYPPLIAAGLFFLASSHGEKVDPHLIQDFVTPERIKKLTDEGYPNHPNEFSQIALLKFLYSPRGTFADRDLAVELIRICSHHSVVEVKKAVLDFIRENSSNRALIEKAITPELIARFDRGANDAVRESLYQFMGSDRAKFAADALVKNFWKVKFANKTLWNPRGSPRWFFDRKAITGAPAFWEQFVESVQKKDIAANDVLALFIYREPPAAFWSILPELLKTELDTYNMLNEIIGTYPWPPEILAKLATMLAESLPAAKAMLLHHIMDKENQFFGDDVFAQISKLANEFSLVLYGPPDLAVRAALFQLHAAGRPIPISLVNPILRFYKNSKNLPYTKITKILLNREWPQQLWNELPKINHIFGSEEIREMILPKIMNDRSIWTSEFTSQAHHLPKRLQYYDDRKAFDQFVKSLPPSRERTILRCRIFVIKIGEFLEGRNPWKTRRK
jgi:hypothetical protein